MGGHYINGRYIAVIEKVKQGSVADLVGHLLPGDEVLEWNGISLTGRTYEDVRDIIAASRQDPSIELVVSRDVTDQSRSRRLVGGDQAGGGMWEHAGPHQRPGKCHAPLYHVVIPQQ